MFGQSCEYAVGIAPLVGHAVTATVHLHGQTIGRYWSVALHSASGTVTASVLDQVMAVVVYISVIVFSFCCGTGLLVG